MKQLIGYTATIVVFFSACSKSATERWDQNKEYSYVLSDDAFYSIDEESHEVSLKVVPNSVPEDGIFFFNLVDQNAEMSSIGIELNYLVPDYEIVSDFILLSSDFDAFNQPCEIKIDYEHEFHYMESWADYQYHFHNHLKLYKISHQQEIEGQITNMNEWVEIPFTFGDTLSSGVGTISSWITDPNALYVVARKY